VVSFYGYPNGVGLYLGSIVILFTGFLYQKSKLWLQIIKVLTILLSFSVILLAQSEGAIFGIIFIWFIWGLIHKKTRAYFSLLAVLGIIIFFSNPMIREYLIEKLTLRDYSSFIRRLIWGETWQMLKHNWFFGAGLNGYQTAILPYHLPTFEVFLYPHNFILNFWSELGILGLFSFLWLSVSFLWKNVKDYFGKIKNGLENNFLNLTLIAVLIQILIHGLVDVPYFRNDLAIIFWLVMAMYVIQKNVFALPKSE